MGKSSSFLLPVPRFVAAVTGEYVDVSWLLLAQTFSMISQGRHSRLLLKSMDLIGLAMKSGLRGCIG